jgi:hypothetical protein
MVDNGLLKSAVVTPQSENSAKLERTAAAVMLKTFGDWMLRTFVPIPPVNARVSKVRSSASVRSASLNFRA